ncbi:hypothetical protein L0Y49_00975 [bacterium]|nr:hypothetical protein [bacterium]
MQKIILLLIFFALPLSVSAARLYFAPAPAGEGEYAVSALLDAPESVNVIEGNIRVPDSVTFLRASDGGSIVKLWVEGAAYDAASRSLSFAGMMPGGFVGNRGKILTIFFKREPNFAEASPGAFSFDTAKTKLYENTGEGTEAKLKTAPLVLTADFFKKAENVNEDSPVPDTAPPEIFNATIARDPEMFDGKYYLIFAGSDSESGILRYEVAEGEKNEVFDYAKLLWKEAKGMYVLEDQGRSVYIYVKAIDNAGNSRIAVLLPAEKFSTLFSPSSPLFWVILIIICLAFGGLYSLYSFARREPHHS